MRDTRWTGLTRRAEPGGRAALLERHGATVSLRIVPIAAWGIPGPGGDLVPLGADGIHLDGPGLLATAPPGTADAELWRLLHRSAAVALETEERMAHEEAA